MSTLKICRYILSDITIIFSNGKSETIPSKNISYFIRDRKFFENYLPILILKVNVSLDLYRKINSDPDAKYKFNMNKMIIKNNVGQVNEYDGNIKSCINTIFKNVNTDNNTPNLASELFEVKYDTDKDKRQDVEKDTIETELILFEYNSLDKYRTNTNKIYTDTNMFNILLKLMSDAGHDKCLISYPDNIGKLYNIIIPNNLTLLGALEHLQNIYGIYSTGFILFKDYDRSYLINKDTKCSAYQQNEYNRIYIKFNSQLSEDAVGYGFTKDVLNMNYSIISSETPSVTNSNDNIKHLAYNKLIAINTETGDKIEKVIDKDDDRNNLKIIDNKYNNKYAINSLMYNLELNKNTVSVKLKEIDIDLIKPNKEFYLNFNINNKHARSLQGLYKLFQSIEIFERETDDRFKNSTKIILKKT